MSAMLRSLFVLAIASLDKSFFFQAADDPHGSPCARYWTKSPTPDRLRAMPAILGFLPISRTLSDAPSQAVAFSAARPALNVSLLACDMQDRIGFVRLLLQRLDSCGCRQYLQFDFAALSFVLHLFHDR